MRLLRNQAREHTNRKPAASDHEWRPSVSNIFTGRYHSKELDATYAVGLPSRERVPPQAVGPLHWSVSQGYLARVREANPAFTFHFLR
jgi:hypothetical protein